jgi:hypothetical protein
MIASMKASAAAAASLVVLLAFPPVVNASRRTYFGPAAGGTNNAGVEVSARLTQGSPVKVKRLEWHNIPGTCSGRSATATTGEFPAAFAVKNGKFSTTGKFNAGRSSVIVTGRFSHHNRRVAGTIRVRGPVAGCPAVDTGVVNWHAKQPAGQS